MKGIRVPIACWSFTLCSSDLAKLDQQWLDNELTFNSLGGRWTKMMIAERYTKTLCVYY